VAQCAFSKCTAKQKCFESDKQQSKQHIIQSLPNELILSVNYRQTKSLSTATLAAWLVHEENIGEPSKQKKEKKEAVITAIITDKIVEQELRRVEE